MRNDTPQERQLYSPFSFFFGDTRNPKVNKLLHIIRGMLFGCVMLYCAVTFVCFLILWIMIGG